LLAHQCEIYSIPYGFSVRLLTLVFLAGEFKFNGIAIELHERCRCVALQPPDDYRLVASTGNAIGEIAATAYKALVNIAWQFPNGESSFAISN